MGPTLSVIVRTRNQRERIARLLAALEKEHAAGTGFEVVVAERNTLAPPAAPSTTG